MKNLDPDTAVRRFIDGELSDEEVRTALHHIADDPGARSLLQFELRMTKELATSQAGRPSPAFARETMNRVAKADSSLSPLERLRAWLESWTGDAILVRVRPLAVLALTVAVAGLALILWPSAPVTRTPVAERTSPSDGTLQPATATSAQTSETVWTRFVYVDDEANSVAVAGDFSQWEPISLSPRTVDGKTVWTGLVRVRRGEHEYQYVIDGEKWVTDPLAPVKRDDGFGAENAVLKL